MVPFIFAQFQIVSCWLANCIFINILVTGNDHEIPTLKELLDVISQYATCWEDIGIQLGVNIKIIEKNNKQDCKACFRETLQEWLKATADATWKMLEDVINKVLKSGD